MKGKEWVFPVVLAIASGLFILGLLGFYNEGDDEEAAAGGGEPVTEQTIVAENIAFDVQAFTVTAGAEVTVTLDHRDIGIPHNIAFEFAKTNLENGPVTQELAFTAPAAGEYEYICDAHPQMAGTMTSVGEGGEAAGQATEEPTEPSEDAGEAVTEATIVGQDVAFDVTELSVAADSEITLTFENQDEGIPHNLAVYTDDSLGELVAASDVENGVVTQTVSFNAPSAGETLYYVCDVHISAMNGTITAE
jgi:plastocyanin